MFGPDRYVPVLKWKAGEQRAVKELVSTVRQRITPLIEIPGLDPKHDPTVALQPHTAKCLAGLVKSWGKKEIFFLDAGSAGMPGAAHPSIYNGAAQAGLQFVPVIGPRRDPAEIGAALQHRSRGVCLRLSQSDFDSATFRKDLLRFAAEHHLKPGDVDLVVDLDSIDSYILPTVYLLSKQLLRVIPKIQLWRTLTLVGSSFPLTMGSVQSHATSRLQRTEWLSWSRLYKNRARLARLPSYGDYAIQHPRIMLDFDFGRMAMSANIRYTTGSYWVIVKGGSVKKYGRRQTHGLAAQLVSSPDFAGPQHCKGCLCISEVSQNSTGPGNPTTWRRVGTCHHLTVVTEQLANLAWP